MLTMSVGFGPCAVRRDSVATHANAPTESPLRDSSLCWADFKNAISESRCSAAYALRDRSTLPLS